MKKLLLLPLLGLLLTACNFASDEDYDQMAEEMCDCWRSMNNNVSNEYKQAIVEAADKQENIQIVTLEHQTNNPELAEHDMRILEELESNEFKGCLLSIETKYNKVYDTGTEKERNAKLLTFIRKKKNCELLYAFAKYESYMDLP